MPTKKIKKYYNSLWSFFNKHINIKMGVLSGIITGSIVFAININHGFWPAFASFWKQFVFNVFMAGYNTKTCEKLAKYITDNTLSLIGASIIPTIQAFIILYAIHYFGKTPEPMASTLWQAIINLFFFLFMALFYREVIHIKSPSFNKIIRVFKLSILRPVRKLNVIAKSKRRAG